MKSFAIDMSSSSFFFNDPAATEIYTLSLHDALPIWQPSRGHPEARRGRGRAPPRGPRRRDRKSTRLNSSHTIISYAVFFLKKKNQISEIEPSRIQSSSLTVNNVQPLST